MQDDQCPLVFRQFSPDMVFHQIDVWGIGRTLENQQGSRTCACAKGPQDILEVAFRCQCIDLCVTEVRHDILDQGCKRCALRGECEDDAILDRGLAQEPSAQRLRPGEACVAQALDIIVQVRERRERHAQYAVHGREVGQLQPSFLLQCTCIGAAIQSCKMLAQRGHSLCAEAHKESPYIGMGIRCLASRLGCKYAPFEQISAELHGAAVCDVADVDAMLLETVQKCCIHIGQLASIGQHDTSEVLVHASQAVCMAQRNATMQTIADCHVRHVQHVEQGTIDAVQVLQHQDDTLLHAQDDSFQE
mmetsp:Transcript_11513/g.41022  ORF Transcript_11513/g.41022 Transcript_11513/m.41022 type:complete len:304 (-) Transcript_11513:1290-2201(-)